VQSQRLRGLGVGGGGVLWHGIIELALGWHEEGVGRQEREVASMCFVRRCLAVGVASESDCLIVGMGCG
jgi:hypothetical protein